MENLIEEPRGLDIIDGKVVLTDPTTGPRYVAFYRVSTKRQANQLNNEMDLSGLEVQRRECREFAARQRATIFRECFEVITGTRKAQTRLKYQDTLKSCVKHQASLLIHKVDRVARSTETVNELKRRGIDIKVATAPDMNRFMLDVVAAMAEEEQRSIADRSRRALHHRKQEHEAKLAELVGDQMEEYRRKHCRKRVVPPSYNASRLGGLWKQYKRNTCAEKIELMSHARAMLMEGQTIKAVSKKLNVSTTTIWRVKHRSSNRDEKILQEIKEQEKKVATETEVYLAEKRRRLAQSKADIVAT
jgi:DNA invertase Pin-like site-specific DNA recombinase